MRFESAGRYVIPPSVRSFDVELQARATVACIPFEDNAVDNKLRSYDVSKLLHSRSIHLTTGSFDTFNWTSIPGYEDHDLKSSFTASVSLPVTIPEHVAHMPSFHSCLVSRDYAIRVRARLQQFPTGTSAAIFVPLLIILGGSTRGDSSQPSNISMELSANLPSGPEGLTNLPRDSQATLFWHGDEAVDLPSYKGHDRVNAEDLREARRVWQGI